MRKNDFSQGDLRATIVKLALPLIGAQLVNVLYNIVDRIYIGNMPLAGQNMLAGLGLTFPIITMASAFAALAGQGGAPLFSIARGAGDDKRAERIMGNAAALLLFFGVACALVGFAVKEPLLRLFGASEATFGYANDYLGIYLAGTPMVMIALGLNPFINSQGFARTGMLTVAIGAAANIVLDPLFIYVFDMGVKGAALATVIAQTLSAIWTARFLTGRKCIIRLTLSSLRPNFRLMREICALGLSSFTMKLTESAVQIVCNRQLGLFGGDAYITVLTVINSIRQIVMLPMNGFTEGAQPVMGYNYGARRPDRVREAFRFVLIVAVSYSVAAWLLLLLAPTPLIRIFSGSEEILSIGPRATRLYFMTFFAMALQMAGQFSFVALGKAKQAIFFSLLRKAFIVVPLTLILPGFIGVDGVFIAEAVSDVVGSCACFVTFMLTVWRRELSPRACLAPGK